MTSEAVKTSDKWVLVFSWGRIMEPTKVFGARVNWGKWVRRLSIHLTYLRPPETTLHPSHSKHHLQAWMYYSYCSIQNIETLSEYPGPWYLFLQYQLVTAQITHLFSPSIFCLLNSIYANILSPNIVSSILHYQPILPFLFYELLPQKTLIDLSNVIYLP